MLEIRYGEHYEIADLAGRSVAQAREQYKEEFGIPDKVRANLNGKGIRQKHEPVTALGDNDSLTFAQKSRKGLFFIGAILLALGITGGVFAYATLTATTTAAITAGDADFADVTAVPANAPSWSVYGAYSGAIPEKLEVFEITPANTFTGDFVVQIYLTNVEELTAVYRVLGMRWEVEKGDFDSVVTVPTDPAFLSLIDPVCEIEVTNYSPDGDGSIAFNVNLDGGFYRSHFYGGGWGAGSAAPSIFCKVVQMGATP